MGRKVHVDPDDVREQVNEAGRQAKALAEQGVEWATPRIEAAVDWAAPRIEQAWRQGVQAAAPKVETAASKASGLADVAAVKTKVATDSAHDALVEIIIPKIVAAMQDAARAAAEATEGAAGAASAKLDDAAAALSGKAGDAASALSGKAEELAAKVAAAGEPARKTHGVGKTLGWIAAGAATAAAGYLVWRRTQPLDDPWAEEYWEDADSGDVSESEAVDALVDAVAEAEAEAESGAEQVADAVADSDAASAAEDAVAEAEAITEEAAEGVEGSTGDDSASEGETGDGEQPPSRSRRRKSTEGDGEPSSEG